MKRVEEVCRVSGVSRRTLQYYDDEGILPAKRSEENYRLYDEAAMERLWEILWYKEMGFKLKEIKEILAVPQKELKKEMKERAVEKGVLDLAKNNAEELIIEMLKSPIGAYDVKIEWQ